MVHHFARSLVGLALALAAAGSVSAAGTSSTSYVPDPLGAPSQTYLVDIKKSQRARVVRGDGFSEAGVGGSSNARILTLDTPFSFDTYADGVVDICGNQPLLRQDTRQLLFRRTQGTADLGRSALVELGTYTNLDGCEVGKVTPFGSLADPGLPLLHRAMALRETMADLLPGTRLAGFAEDASTGAVDVAEFLSKSRLRFASTRTVVGTSMTTDGWLLFSQPGEQRGYTRISVDALTGAETWLRATFLAGAPVSVNATMMVKPKDGASFGSVKQASRMWESGLFAGSPSPFSIYLYRDGNGERVNWDDASSSELRVPITWHFEGNNILQDRAYFADVTRTRTWQPIADHGNYRFVLESEVANFSEGPEPYIQTRVNYYIDRGRAGPPPQASFHQSKPAIAAGTAKMPRKIGNSSLQE